MNTIIRIFIITIIMNIIIRIFIITIIMNIIISIIIIKAPILCRGEADF